MRRLAFTWVCAVVLTALCFSACESDIVDPMCELGSCPAGVDGGALGTDGGGALGTDGGGTCRVGTGALVFEGNGGENESSQTIDDALDGVATFTETLPSDLSSYRIVFLMSPVEPFTSTELDRFQAYVNGGGVLVLGGESDWHRSGNHAVLNDVLAHLGSTTQFVAASLDPSQPCEPRANRVASHPLSDELDQIEYAWSSDLLPDPETIVLFSGESGQPVVAVRGRVVLVTDMSIFDSLACAGKPGDVELTRRLYELEFGCP